MALAASMTRSRSACVTSWFLPEMAMTPRLLIPLMWPPAIPTNAESRATHAISSAASTACLIDSTVMLIAKFATALSLEVPGVSMSFTQPIEMRFNEMIAGVRSDVAVKIFGEDLLELTGMGEKAARILRQIPGGQDVRVEQVAGLPVLRLQVERRRIARYGINEAEVLAAVEAAGAGRIVGTVFEGQRRFPLVVRAVGGSRTDLPSFQDLPVAAPNGALIPLAQLASVTIEEGPAQVSREDISRRIVVGR